MVVSDKGQGHLQGHFLICIIAPLISRVLVFPIDKGLRLKENSF